MDVFDTTDNGHDGLISGSIRGCTHASVFCNKIVHRTSLCLALLFQFTPLLIQSDGQYPLGIGMIRIVITEMCTSRNKLNWEWVLFDKMKQEINRDYLQNHNNDVERSTWCLNSGVFVQYVVEADNKQPINFHSVIPLLSESTGDRCIPSNDSPDKSSVIKKPFLCHTEEILLHSKCRQ